MMSKKMVAILSAVMLIAALLPSVVTAETSGMEIVLVPFLGSEQVLIDDDDSIIEAEYLVWRAFACSGMKNQLADVKKSPRNSFGLKDWIQR